MTRAIKVCAISSMMSLGPASHAIASTIVAATCSNTSVQAAVNAAVNGDTVLIPAGTCTWTAGVTIPNTKGITLQGAGIDNTTIVDGVPTEIPLRINLLAGHPITRLTALTLNANLTLKGGDGPQIYVSGSGLDTFRIDHIRIQNLKQRGIMVNAQGNELSGVIDHNVFDCPGDFSCHAVDLIGADSENSTPFSHPISLGDNHFIFVEDNLFNYAFHNDGAQDAYGGARYVFRFNAVKEGDIEHHGADSGGYRGVHSFEVYGNTFTRTNTKSWSSYFFRSGTGVMFDNAWSTNYNEGALAIFRARPEVFAPWGQCNGSSVWDGNLGSGSNPGWPCLDQTGHVFTQNPGGAQTDVPMYFWNNLRAGNPIADPRASEASMAPYLVLNRDFYNTVASFTGATGVGRGPIASRPSTCTTGVAYWATDEGEWNSSQAGADGRLYKCTATDTWTLYYTPYTYPHPLTTGRLPPTAPRNLRIVP